MNSDAASLDRLHDIVVPPAAPGWPPAPGWYYIIVLVLCLVLVFLVRGVIRWQRNRYRREALAEFRQQERRLHDPAQRVAALAALGALLKRAAITAYPRGEVAALTGAAWFDFLDQTGSTTAFRASVGGKLAAATYAPLTVIDLGDNEAAIIAASVRDWIRHHETGSSQDPNSQRPLRNA